MARAAMRCVITGAANGIGKALAFAFASQGYSIIGVDCDKTAAETTTNELRNSGAEVKFLIADIGKTDERQRLIEDLSKIAPITVLIHCAGINRVGRFIAEPLDRQLELLSVNLEAPMSLTAGLLAKHSIIRGGAIVCIGSLSSYVGYPGAAVYAASKDGLASYARSLSVALAPRGIHVLIVYPGPTRTEHAARHSPNNSRESSRMPPQALAQMILDAVAHGRHSLVPGWRNRVWAFSAMLFPRVADRLLKRSIFQKLDVFTK